MNIPETEYIKKVPEAPRIPAPNQGLMSLVLPRKCDHVFAVIWWGHASIFDAWPRLVF